MLSPKSSWGLSIRGIRGRSQSIHSIRTLFARYSHTIRTFEPCDARAGVDQKLLYKNFDFGCNRHHQWEISGAHREMEAVPVRMVKPTVAPIASRPRT